METRRDHHNSRATVPAAAERPRWIAMLVAGCLCAGALAGMLTTRAFLASRSEAAGRDQRQIADLVEQIRALGARLDARQEGHSNLPSTARTEAGSPAAGHEEIAAPVASGEMRPWEADDFTSFRRVLLNAGEKQE